MGILKEGDKSGRNELLAQHPNEYVVLLGEQLIAHSADLEEAWTAFEGLDNSMAIVVPPEPLRYSAPVMRGRPTQGTGEVSHSEKCTNDFCTCECHKHLADLERQLAEVTEEKEDLFVSNHQLGDALGTQEVLLKNWASRWKGLAKKYLRTVRIHERQTPPTAKGYLELWHQREALRDERDAALRLRDAVSSDYNEANDQLFGLRAELKEAEAAGAVMREVLDDAIRVGRELASSSKSGLLLELAALRKIREALPKCHECSRTGTRSDRYTYFCDEHHIHCNCVVDVVYADAIRALDKLEGSHEL